MKDLIQLISQPKNSKANIEDIISDEFLESSLRELSLKPSSEEDVQKWLNILTPQSEPQAQPKLVKLNFAMISQIAAAIIIGVSLAVLTPQFGSQSQPKALADTQINTAVPINNAIQLTDTPVSVSNEDIALAATWVQESVQTQSAGIYEAANGNLYHAVEFNYLELPDTNGTVKPKLQRKTEYIFIPVEETY